MKTLVKLTLECLSVPYDDNVMELKSDEFKGAGKTNYINASPIAFENCAQVMKNCCLKYFQTLIHHQVSDLWISLQNFLSHFFEKFFS